MRSEVTPELPCDGVGDNPSVLVRAADQILGADRAISARIRRTSSGAAYRVRWVVSSATGLLPVSRRLGQHRWAGLIAGGRLLASASPRPVSRHLRSQNRALARPDLGIASLSPLS